MSLSPPPAKKAGKILIVDDDPLIRLGLEKFFVRLGYATVSAGTGKTALNKIEEEEELTVVLLDLKLPDSYDGLSLLEIIKKTRPQLTVIMISGQTEIRGAVEAMKLGARDYLEKPIDFDRLKNIFEALDKESSAAAPEKSRTEEDDLIFSSPRMKNVLDLIQRLALKSDITVLLLGESGTGKNFLCQRLHDLSPRRDYPYVQIGCSNIPEHLIESELFGYEKGAFTDAKNSKKGLIEIAEGGTVLLDELGEMPYTFQSKVLRLLEEKCFRRIGALHDTKADVRILAATNRNLFKLVQEKKFRLDLFYRLNTATIEIPPLRERTEDIPQLVTKFLKDFAKKYDSTPKKVVQDALLVLQSYSWPGNIRQLKNLLEKLVVLSECDTISADEIRSNLLLSQQFETDEVTPSLPVMQSSPAAGYAAPLPSALPPQSAGGGHDTASSSLSLTDMEEKHIRTALRLANGNQRKAAKLLNISRDTLRYRLKKFNIDTSGLKDD